MKTKQFGLLRQKNIKTIKQVFPRYNHGKVLRLKISTRVKLKELDIMNINSEHISYYTMGIIKFQNVIYNMLKK